MDAIVEGPNYEFATETHEVRAFAGRKLQKAVRSMVRVRPCVCDKD